MAAPLNRIGSVSLPAGESYVIGRPMINRETINNRFKLACHRLVARRIASDPALLERASEIVAEWSRESDRPDFVDEWREILAQPIAEIRRTIVLRDQRMERLRISSPFLAIRTECLDDNDRLRLWRIVRRPYGKLKRTRPAARPPSTRGSLPPAGAP